MGNADFDNAILRAVAGVEKKRSLLQGVEKDVVAKHEVGHALVATGECCDRGKASKLGW